jgi:16S rRNA (uracil1498-N3)-methyltransferase
MSNIRLFFSNSLSANLTDKLDKSQSHYLTKVMRVKENEVFSLFNKGGEWEAKILGISKSIVEFKTTKQLRHKENTKELWLAFSPIKSNYQNFMLQKATEIGVTKFFPITTERTIVRKINNERLSKIIIEASEQSNRINIPKLENLLKFENFLKDYNKKINLIFTDLNSDQKKIDFDDTNSKPLCIIVGPEGDFSESERQKILYFEGVQSLKLSENILRSETAVISALSIINFIIN